MKTFFKDYGQLCKQTGSFYKKHWLGTIITTIVSCGLTIAVFWPKELKEAVADNVKSKFKKESKKVES